MSKGLTLEDLQNINFDENEDTIIANDKSHYQNYSKDIALTLGYLMGVREEQLERIPNTPEDYNRIIDEVSKNESARVIRHLNNIRSTIILGFKDISRRTRISAANYTPIYKIEYLEDDFKTLKKLGIDITTGRNDLVEYIKITNDEISKRIDKTKSLFPDWINFKHIKNAFIMPKDIETERKKFMANQTCYPYRKYFNWKTPYEAGNILLSDEKILDIIYYSDGAYFTESNKVVDASEHVKDSINEFIQLGYKVQIFIDGENTDPYKFVAALDSLSDDEIDKIDKIVVYYDKKYSTRAWQVLKHFSNGIEIEANAVERLLDEKSLVDHKLVAGVSKAVYQDRVDSIILCSSDSDFWSVIEDVNARYLVMAEIEKCGYDFKEVLREHDIFYCYLDRFKVPHDNKFFKMVFRKELQKQIDSAINELNINVRNLFNSAITESRADVSKQEKENIFNDYVKGLQIKIEDDKFSIVVPE